ncbi:1-phosphofructokinase family hexose kinase [Nesterenkonia flava]|uniref:1-phosphofructokinase family hexose kinase n=1 Tax=Nesterenkonia flava TaxID=469799 RepID=A0ABU1FQJ3_9MICC|nr:1-phosphofructokinase family hexose kinase [Nesterenkonia flava]MDR5710923.1 1-phosphofructokinase family hexose kinase [Nesterenkonia flava]
MIVTVTPNPSLDKTVELSGPLAVGQVQRATGQHAEPGGKGVNIARALAAAGDATLALLPGDPSDPVISALHELAVPHRSITLGQPLRTNIAVTDPQGITTKINELGPRLSPQHAADFTALILREAAGASWIAMAGSLPPGLPADFYQRTIGQVRRASAPALVAVDASGDALVRAAAGSPDLIKPNAEELKEVAGRLLGAHQVPRLTAAELEGSKQEVARLVRALQAHGIRAALVTLGRHGAVFVPANPSEPVLAASGPPLVVRSTVGAGDASLAGFLSAHERGATASECLRHAMAQGRAAASLPGSTMPGPEDLRLSDVVVEELTL